MIRQNLYMTCNTCAHLANEAAVEAENSPEAAYCALKPKWYLLKKPDTHYCGMWQKSPEIAAAEERAEYNKMRRGPEQQAV
jgi:hypothetical protein